MRWGQQAAGRGGALSAAWPMTGSTAAHSQLGSPDLLFSLFSVDSRPSPLQDSLQGSWRADALVFLSMLQRAWGLAAFHWPGLLAFVHSGPSNTLRVSRKRSSAEGYVGHTPLGSCAKSCGAGAAVLSLPVLAPPTLRRVGQVAGPMGRGGGKGF